MFNRRVKKNNELYNLSPHAGIRKNILTIGCKMQSHKVITLSIQLHKTPPILFIAHVQLDSA